MNRSDLYKLHKELTDKAFKLMENKNRCYSSNEDALNNFMASLEVGVHPFKGVLVRMLDKLKRSSNVVHFSNDPALLDESIEDTFVDLINYSILAYAVFQETKKDFKAPGAPPMKDVKTIELTVEQRNQIEAMLNNPMSSSSDSL